ncbi:MAG TPA: hypothetical protein EYP60_01010 [bacterium (Candidatus Stahlbacteria)]|nr:hypothetical protein [Candidatus Stahlbacteria bacterium]
MKKISLTLFLAGLSLTPITAYGAAPLMLGSLVVWLIRNKNEKVFINLLDKLQLACLGTILLSAVFAVYKLESLVCGSIFLLYLISYNMAKVLIRDSEDMKKVINWLAYITIILAVVGILQFFPNYSLKIKGVVVIATMSPTLKRVTSLSSNPLILASFLAFVLPLFVVALLQKYKRILLVISISLGLFVLFLTVSRGPIIAMFFSLIFLLLFLKRRILWVLLGILLISCFILKPARIRFEKTFTQSIDLARRVAIKAGLKMWSDHNSLTGIGVHNFFKLYKDYVSPDYEKWHLPYVHCLYLNSLVETGIIGLSTLILMLIILLRYLWYVFKRSNGFERAFYLGLFASFIGFLIHNLVDNTPYTVGLGILFWSSMGIVSSGRDEITKA